MAYSAPSTISTGDLITAAKWNADVSANPIAIYAGAMSVASQAIGDILYASSTTQFARVAAVATGQVLASAGTGTVPAYSATPALTSVDMGGTTVYGSRAITVDTGGVLNVVLASSAGDDFTVDTDKLVVSGDTGSVGIGNATPDASRLDLGLITDSDATLSSTVSDYQLNIGSATTVNEYGHAICFSDGSTISAAINGYDRGSSGGMALKFATMNTSGAFADRLTIDHDGDVYSTAYTDYYSSSTIVGWSSLTAGRRRIMYKTIGKLVFVWFHLEGTSNATTVSFTLPYTSTAVGFSNQFHNLLSFTYNNTAAVAIQGVAALPVNSAVCTCNLSPTAAGGWTSSGTKIVAGQFTYEMA